MSDQEDHWMSPREELLAEVRVRQQQETCLSCRDKLRALEALAQPRYGLGATASQQRCVKALAILQNEGQ